MSQMCPPFQHPPSHSNSYPEKQINNYTFSLQNLLGKGSYSSVYLGTDINTHQPVAIKVIENHLLRDAFISNLITQECQIMQSLSHKNVVKLHQVLSTSNNTYIIQEYCNQKDLKSLMAQKSTFSESEAVLVFEQILEGFKELLNHGVIHRDIKPANILISDDLFKIADFGFAIHVNELADNLKSSLVGTPLYMSPQCLRGESYSTKNDIWSMGIILYEMLFGDVPWPVASKFELMQAFKLIPLRFPHKHISPALRDLIERCLRIEESERIDWESIYRHPLFKKDGIEAGMSFSRDGNNRLIGINYENNLDLAVEAEAQENTVKETILEEAPKEIVVQNTTKQAAKMPENELVAKQKLNENELKLRIFVIFGIFENLSLMNQKFMSGNDFSFKTLWECEGLLMRVACKIAEGLMSSENPSDLQGRLSLHSQWTEIQGRIEKKHHTFMQDLRKNHEKDVKSDAGLTNLSLSEALKRRLKELMRQGNHRLYQQYIEFLGGKREKVDEGLFQFVGFLVSGLRLVEENERNGLEGLVENLFERKLLPEIKKGPVKGEDLKKLREVIYESD